MPRGVTKTKDGGVGKKGKEVGKKIDKRSRKMRGGEGTFVNYCDSFIYNNKDKYNEMIGEIDKFLQQYLNPDEKSSRFLGSRKSELYSLIEGINILKIYKTSYPTDNNTKFTHYNDVGFKELLSLYKEIKKQIDKPQTDKKSEDLQNIYKKIIFCKIFMLMLGFKHLCEDDGTNLIARIIIPDNVEAKGESETETQLVVSHDDAAAVVQQNDKSSGRQLALAPPSGVSLLGNEEDLHGLSPVQSHEPSIVPSRRSLKDLNGLPPSIVTGSEGSSAITLTPPLPREITRQSEKDDYNFYLNYNLDNLISKKVTGKQIDNKEYQKKKDEWMKSEEYESTNAVLVNMSYPDEIKKEIRDLFSNIYIDISNYYYSNEIDDLFTKIKEAQAKMKQYINTTITSEDTKEKLIDALVAYIKFYHLKGGIDMLLKHKLYLRTLENAIEIDMISTLELSLLNDRKTLNMDETIKYLKTAYEGLKRNSSYIEIQTKIDIEDYDIIIRRTIKEDILGYINELIKNLQSLKNKVELIELIDKFIKNYKYSTFKKSRLANINTYEDIRHEYHIHNFAEQFLKTYIDAVKIAMVANAHYISILEKFKKHLEEVGDDAANRVEVDDAAIRVEVDNDVVQMFKDNQINNTDENKDNFIKILKDKFKITIEGIVKLLNLPNTSAKGMELKSRVKKGIAYVINLVYEILNTKDETEITAGLKKINAAIKNLDGLKNEEGLIIYNVPNVEIKKIKSDIDNDAIENIVTLYTIFCKFCYDNLRKLFQDKTSSLNGGQPQKPPRKKPAKTPKPKEPQPTKTPKPAKTPKPTKTPKPKPTKKPTRK